MCGWVSLRIAIDFDRPGAAAHQVERPRPERRIGQVLRRHRADLLLGEDAARAGRGGGGDHRRPEHPGPLAARDERVGHARAPAARCPSRRARKTVPATGVS